MSITALIKTLKLPFSSLAGVITTLFTMAGGIYALQSYRDGLPCVIVEADSLSLRASIDLNEVYADLVKIENTYGRVTADKINDMKKIAAHLTYYEHDSIEKLLTMVYKNIDNFQTYIPEWRANQIFYLPDGKIMWPDSTTFDIAKNPKADKLFPDQFAIVRRDPVHVSEHIKTKIKEQAFTLYQPFGKNNNVRLDVADALRVVRSKLEQLKDVGNYFVEVQFTLINESTTPNFLASTQTVKLKSKTPMELELRMLNTEQRKLEGKGISRVKARSRFFSEADSSLNRKMMFDFFRRHGGYSMHVSDLDKNKWLGKEQRENDGSPNRSALESFGSRFTDNQAVVKE
ncbi:MAG TPA: hypothetical protein VKQ08_12115 [Cyclobacteriaceae bacterium]|nr:hypothetical protein [Cyclobacteriaceae bacterium]